MGATATDPGAAQLRAAEVRRDRRVRTGRCRRPTGAPPVRCRGRRRTPTRAGQRRCRRVRRSPRGALRPSSRSPQRRRSRARTPRCGCRSCRTPAAGRSGRWQGLGGRSAGRGPVRRRRSCAGSCRWGRTPRCARWRCRPRRCRPPGPRPGRGERRAGRVSSRARPRLRGTAVCGLSLTTRWLMSSATYTLPAASRATP